MIPAAARSISIIGGHSKRRAASCALLLCLLIVVPAPARADDELASSIRTLALTAGRIRVISENCRVPVDPLLEAPMVEALASVPDVSLTDVASLLMQSRQMQLSASGRECRGAEDAQHLRMLMNIYEMSIQDLKELVTKRY